MDISEFLASMQSNPGDRALARNSKVEMGIPDVDNDPTTENAGASDDGMGQDLGMDQAVPEENSQMFEAGGAPYKNDERWSQLPESQNIEDRRGETFDPEKQKKLNLQRKISGVTAALDEGVGDFAGKLGFNAGKNKRVKKDSLEDQAGYNDIAKFEEGGVPDEEGAGAPEQEVTGAGIPQSGEQGAIPMPSEEGTTPEVAPPEGAPQKEGDWRSKAMDAITEGMRWGYDKVHAINRAIGGEQDPEHVASFKSMASGKGAMSQAQYSAAMAAVDPDGTMSETQRRLKALGTMYDFYSKSDPAQAAAAAWSMSQYGRGHFNMNAAGATHAIDVQANDKAAKMAERALNQVPGDNETHIKWLPVNKVAGEVMNPDRDDAMGTASKAVMGAVGAVGTGLKAIRDSIGTPAKQSVEKQYAAAQTPGQQGLPEQAGINDIGAMPAGPGASQEQAPPMAAPEAGTRTSLSGQMDNGMFRIIQTDSESGRVVLDTSITPEQLQHVLSEGWDKAIHRGTTAMIGAASQMQEGHGHIAGRRHDTRVPIQDPSSDPRLLNSRDARALDAEGKGVPSNYRSPDAPEGEDPAEANGLPKGMNVRGLSGNQLGALRQQNAARTVAEAGHGEKERVTQAGRLEVAKVTNTSNERREHIRAGNNPDTGERSTNEPSGKQAALMSNRETQAARQAKIEFDNSTDPKKNQQQILAKWRKQYGLNDLSGQSQQGARPQQQSNPNAGAPQPGTVKNGYTFKGGDPSKRENWEQGGG